MCIISLYWRYAFWYKRFKGYYYTELLNKKVFSILLKFVQKDLINHSLLTPFKQWLSGHDLMQKHCFLLFYFCH